MSEAKTLTRAALTGETVRIQKTYGHTPIGIRAMCRLQRALGGRSILELMLPRIEHRRAFDNVNGVRARARAPISVYERARRELDARLARGEPLDMFARRQAS